MLYGSPRVAGRIAAGLASQCLHRRATAVYRNHLDDRPFDVVAVVLLEDHFADRYDAVVGAVLQEHFALIIEMRQRIQRSSGPGLDLENDAWAVRTDRSVQRPVGRTASVARLPGHTPHDDRARDDR